MKKKLQLKKEIVSILDRNQMNNLTKGGAATLPPQCGIVATMACISQHNQCHTDVCIDPTISKYGCGGETERCDSATTCNSDLCPVISVGNSCIDGQGFVHRGRYDLAARSLRRCGDAPSRGREPLRLRGASRRPRVAGAADQTPVARQRVQRLPSHAAVVAVDQVASFGEERDVEVRDFAHRGVALRPAALLIGPDREWLLEEIVGPRIAHVERIGRKRVVPEAFQ